MHRRHGDSTLYPSRNAIHIDPQALAQMDLLQALPVLLPWPAATDWSARGWSHLFYIKFVWLLQFVVVCYVPSSAISPGRGMWWRKQTSPPWDGLFLTLIKRISLPGDLCEKKIAPSVPERLPFLGVLKIAFIEIQSKPRINTGAIQERVFATKKKKKPDNNNAWTIFEWRTDGVGEVVGARRWSSWKDKPADHLHLKQLPSRVHSYWYWTLDSKMAYLRFL